EDDVLQLGGKQCEVFGGERSQKQIAPALRERSSSTLSLSHCPSRNRTNARRSDDAPDLPAALVSHLRVCCLCGIRQRCCEVRDLDKMPAQWAPENSCEPTSHRCP